MGLLALKVRRRTPCDAPWYDESVWGGNGTGCHGSLAESHIGRSFEHLLSSYKETGRVDPAEY